jgi:hypothetical protein
MDADTAINSPRPTVVSTTRTIDFPLPHVFEMDSSKADIR